MLPFPTTLATLPKSAIAKGKKVHAAPVHSLGFEQYSTNAAGKLSLRRKERSEVVLALPGGGVQVYDVRAARLVTSYATSPDAKFVCAPVSVLLQPPARNRGIGRRRVTVAAIQLPDPAAPTKLVLWDESLGQDVPLPERIKSRQKEVQVGELTRIDATAAVSDDGAVTLCLVGVEEGGVVSCWNEELESITTLAVADPPHKVEAVFLVDLEQARRGLLPRREDVAIAAAAGAMHDLVVTISVSETAEQESKCREATIKIHGLHLSTSSGAQSVSRPSSIQELASIPLPMPEHSSKNTPKFSFHPGSGNLFQYSKKHLAVFRLAGIVPKLEHEINFNDQASSIAPLSASVFAITTSSSVDILDAKYKAVLSTYRLHGPGSESQSPLANGVNGVHSPEKAKVELVAFYPSLGIVIAVRDHNALISIAVEEQVGIERPRKKLRHTSLADAVGKGMQLASRAPYSEVSFDIPLKLGKVLGHQPLEDTFREDVQELDQAVEEGNSGRFEEAAQRILEPQGSFKPPNPQALDAVMTRILPLKSSEGRNHVNLSVKLGLWPHNIALWLAQHGYITQHQLELAHKRQGNLSVSQSLESCTVITAVGGFDRSLRVLMQLLESDVALSAQEIARAMCIALQRIQQTQGLRNMKLIKDNSVDATMQNGTPPQGEEYDEDDNYARQTMESCLRRLEHTSAPSLHAVLSSELSTSDLLTLIDYLRVSVAQSGWLTPYSDHVAAAATTHVDQMGQLPFTLLNVTLDVLGANAWLRGTSTNDTQTLTYMRAEVAAALETVEESAYLAGLLGEVLLYARTVPYESTATLERAQTEAGATPDEQQQLLQRIPVKPVLVVDADADAVDAAGALPLGLRYREGAHDLERERLMKTRPGGKVEKRSLREVGHLKSMRVGKHTLERIVF